MLRAVISFIVVASLGSAVGLSQLPTYQVGRTPTAQEVHAVDTYVGPSGEGLAEGRGTAREGARIYAAKCAFCHGATGVEGRYPNLKMEHLRPFPTSIWSTIYNSMPRRLPDVGVRGEQLPANEAYALTAFVLHLNGVIDEDTVVDQSNLAGIRIPSRDSRVDYMVQPGK